MTDRIALITGGAKGIGRAIGLDLASRGWDIALCYRSSEEAARETAERVSAQGRRAFSRQCDVSDPRAVEGLVKAVREELGPVDALINCAGPYHRVSLLEETVEGWHSMFDNNLHPVFYLSRLLAPDMKERGWGRIISFSMATADRVSAQPQITAHFIAKQGLLVLSRSLARLLAPHGITVNTISPGFVASGSAPEEELAAMVKRIPAGYVGSLDDTTALARFLVSDEARYVNGANLHVSGGWGL